MNTAGILAGASGHPMARAVARFCPAHGATIAVGMKTVPGRGVIDESTGRMLGSPAWLTASGMHWPADLTEALHRAEQTGQSATAIAWGGTVRGLFLLSEQLRPGLNAVLARLAEMNLSAVVLTGDTIFRARAIGTELGVEVRGGLLPEDKVRLLDEYRSKVGAVAMVGDGLNDAPALAHADVGIALGCGADVARESAAVCLLGDDLALVPETIAIARQTVKVMRRNLVWAFGYNVVGLAWACSGTLSPVVAAVAMVVSSAFVIAGSLRLAGGSLVATTPTPAEVVSPAA